MKTILKEWSECDNIKVFEFQVIDKRTGETEWLLFDISIENGKFYAMHEALTQIEKESGKIAYCMIDIDPDFSLDKNLQDLLDECNEAVMSSDFYEISYEC